MTNLIFFFLSKNDFDITKFNKNQTKHKKNTT